MSEVEYERVGGVARITMNRPRYRNAQSRRLLELLDDAFDTAMADENVRVVVLFGAGEHFSSGHDLGTSEDKADWEARPYPDGMYGSFRKSWDFNVANTMRWRDLPKPTIAAVQGLCIHGGWMVASAMDLIVAADDAQFIPGLFQYQSTPWEIGVRRAKEVLWEQDLLDANDLKDLGFVAEVVPREHLDDRVMAKAQRIAEKPMLMLHLIKRQINDAQDAMGFRQAIQNGHTHYFLSSVGGTYFDDGQEAQGRRVPGVDEARRAYLARKQGGGVSD